MATLTATNVGSAGNLIEDISDLDAMDAFGVANGSQFGISAFEDFAVVFTGSGFDTPAGDNLPTTGTITGLTVYSWDGDSFEPAWSCTGFAGFTVADFQTWIDNPTVAAGAASFTSAIFGGADTITGSTNSVGDGDELSGYGGNDTINGNAGNDILAGGAGDDTVNGGDGLDILTLAENTETDSYDGGAHFDTLAFAGVVSGAVAIDARNATFSNFEAIVFAPVTGFGTTQIDATLSGAQFGAGAGLIPNTFLGVIGSAVIDVLNITDIAGTLDLTTWAFNTWGANDFVNLYGDSGANVLRTKSTIAASLIGYDGADQLYGSNLTDYLYGSTVADGDQDDLYGGNGNDVYNVYELTDIIHETGGGGTGDYAAVACNNYVMANNLENMAMFNGAAVATGNAGVNDIQGNFSTNVAETISGMGGNDFLYGYGAADILIGGTGGDTLDGGAGGDTASYATSAAAVNVNLATGAVSGGDAVGDTFVSIEFLIGSAFDDTLTAGTGGNRLTGGDGNDTLNGGGGVDTMIGGLGNDTYVVDNADLTTEAAGAGTGIDTVLASVTHTLALNVENLTLTGTGVINGTGNTLANVINGNTKANTLNGGGGADTLNGGVGIDTLTGGAGGDKFVFNVSPTAANADNITDFTHNSDKIHLENAIFIKLTTPGVLGVNEFWAGAAAHDADDRVIYDSVTGKLYYDANGNVAGQQFLVATLATGLTITNTDFVVI